MIGIERKSACTVRVTVKMRPDDYDELQRIPVIWQHSLHVCNNGRIPAA